MTMPRLGESVTEGTIINWLVKVGDQIDKYDPICEVQTVKVVAEVPASFSGKVVKLLAQTDDTVAVGEPIIVLDTDDDSAQTPVTETAAQTPQTPVSAPEQPVTAPEVIPAPQAPQPTSTTIQAKTAPRFSPAVAKLLSDHQLDPKMIPATGHEGRLTRKDVQQFMTKRPLFKAPDKSAKEPEAIPVAPLEGDTVTPASSIRKAIAEHMLVSKAQIPHGWMMVEQDVSDLVQLRQSVKQSFQTQEGIKLTYFPFFIKAIAQALAKHPRVNGTWQDDQIITHKDINISIAVAKDDELYVPVIKHADRLSVKGIALEIDRLAKAVRSGQASIEDMQGGTFTVNNTGSFGSVASMGIINFPQAAIIQVESIRKEIKPSADGRSFKVADMVNLSLSVDHRLLDGVAAGGFLTDVKRNLAAFKPGINLY